MAGVSFYWPNAITFNGTTQTNATTYKLDATTREYAVVMYAEEDCTIEKIGWLQATTSLSSGTPATPGTLRIGLQTVTTTGSPAGVPSGTWLGGGTGYVDYSGWSTGDNGKYVISTLGTNVTLARGDVFAIVLKPQAVGTWSATNFVDIGYFAPQDSLLALPYIVLGGAKQSVARNANTFLRSSTRAYGFPYETNNTWAIVNTQSPAEVGIKFKLPAGMCDTFKINGFGIFMNTNTGSTFTVRLYEGTSRTVLQSIAIDSDQTGTGPGYGMNYFYFDNSTLSTLTAGTDYRLTIEATSATDAGDLHYAILADANDMTAYIGTESTFHWTEWGGSSYTDRTTRLPQIVLSISDITEPASGGGGMLVHPGMTGGIRG